MRIKKTSNTRALAGKVVNTYSESTTDTYSCDYLNTKLNNYSTTEQRIGTWIDGKPIYRKTIVYNDNNGLQAGFNTIRHNVNNIGNHKIVKEEEYISNNENFKGYVDSTSFVSSANVTSSAIIVDCGSSWASLFKEAYITIEYTKTTD